MLHSVDWVLVFADDGCGCISDAITATTLLLEDLFHKKLMRRGSSEFIVEGEGLEATCSDLESIARRFEEGTTKLYVGVSHTFELPMYQLLRPRCGMRTFWCAHGLYTVLKVQSYQGAPSKWFYEQYKSWQAVCTSHGFCGQVMLSLAGISVEEATHSTTRFLPTPPCRSWHSSF